MPLTPYAEAALTPTGFAEVAVSNPALASVDPTAALPALYPSAATYPSAAGTYPSAGTPATGISFDALGEGSATITPIAEESH